MNSQGLHTDDEVIYRLNEEVDKLKRENEVLRDNFWNEESKKKSEWLINGIKVTVTAELVAGTMGEIQKVDYVFRMDGYRADVLQGWEVLEKIVWLNKLEKEQ